MPAPDFYTAPPPRVQPAELVKTMAGRAVAYGGVLFHDALRACRRIERDKNAGLLEGVNGQADLALRALALSMLTRRYHVEVLTDRKERKLRTAQLVERLRQVRPLIAADVWQRQLAMLAPHWNGTGQLLPSGQQERAYGWRDVLRDMLDDLCRACLAQWFGPGKDAARGTFQDQLNDERHDAAFVVHYELRRYGCAMFFPEHMLEDDDNRLPMAMADAQRRAPRQRTSIERAAAVSLLRAAAGHAALVGAS